MPRDNMPNNAPQSTTSWSFRSCAALVGLVCVLLTLPGPARSEAALTIYFHNPEVSTVRNEVLKTVFDRYLQQHGNFTFQPVAQPDTFASLLTLEDSALFMLPSWYFEQLRRQAPGLTPRLHGIKQSRAFYHKVLVSAGQPLPETHIVVALAGTESHGQRMLASMLRPEQLRSVQLLLVPKDIDALMSLNFGLADAALTRENSLRTFLALHHDMAGQLNELGRSPPIPGLLVASLRADDARLEAAIRALSDMPGSEDGRFGLNMLGLDAWESERSPNNKGGQAQQ